MDLEFLQSQTIRPGRRQGWAAWNLNVQQRKAPSPAHKINKSYHGGMRKSQITITQLRSRGKPRDEGPSFSGSADSRRTSTTRHSPAARVIIKERAGSGIGVKKAHRTSESMNPPPTACAHQPTPVNQPLDPKKKTRDRCIITIITPLQRDLTPFPPASNSGVRGSIGRFGSRDFIFTIQID